MTERELAGIIGALSAISTSLESAVLGGQKVNTTGGMSVVVTREGLEDTVRNLRKITTMLLEAIPPDPIYVKREDEEKQQEQIQEEETGQEAEAGNGGEGCSSTGSST